MGQAYGIQRARSRKVHDAQRKQSHNHGEGSGEVRKSRCTRAKCNKCCKSFMAFLFSTVGLVIMVAAYSVAGGFLFRLIEEGVEEEKILEGREMVKNSTEQHLRQLWLITDRLNILHPDNWTAEASVVFLQYQKEVYNATVSSNWDGQAVNETVYTKWNFAGALLYAVTAITTIGYGHVTPKTPWGMASTIIYCLFGLPLTLMCIANLGKFFARVFRILYHTCCCGVCCICCLSYKKRKAANKLGTHQNVNGEAGDIQTVENGQSVVMTNDPMAQMNRSRLKSNTTLSKAQVWMLNVKKKFSHSLKDDVTVPVYLCLVVMAVYIIFGALIFALWDGWGFLVGAYFCFVTLTTIGFGDYVPGIIDQGAQGPDGTERLVLCSIYVFLGLALIGMCIDLMQADILQKIAWLGHKIGISGNQTKKKSDMELNVPLRMLSSDQVTETFPTKFASVSGKQAALGDNIEYEQETQHLKHSKQNGDNRKSKASASGKLKKRGDRKCNNARDTLKDEGSETRGDKVELGDDFLCLPPPAYAEFDSHSKPSLPATPTSHYDNLPNEAATLTPIHDRLRDVTIHEEPRPAADSSKQMDKNQKRLKDKTKHNRAEGSTKHGSSNDKLESELMLADYSSTVEQSVCMQMENEDDGEILLKVTAPPQL